MNDWQSCSINEELFNPDGKLFFRCGSLLKQINNFSPRWLDKPLCLLCVVIIGLKKKKPNKHVFVTLEPIVISPRCCCAFSHRFNRFFLSYCELLIRAHNRPGGTARCVHNNISVWFLSNSSSAVLSKLGWLDFSTSSLEQACTGGACCIRVALLPVCLSSPMSCHAISEGIWREEVGRSSIISWVIMDGR